MTHDATDHSAQLQLEKLSASSVTNAVREVLDIEALYERLFAGETWDEQLQALERAALATADADDRETLLTPEQLSRVRDTVWLQVKLNPAADRAYSALVAHEQTAAFLRERLHRALGATLGALRDRMAAR